MRGTNTETQLGAKSRLLSFNLVVVSASLEMTYGGQLDWAMMCAVSSICPERVAEPQKYRLHSYEIDKRTDKRHGWCIKAHLSGGAGMSSA